MRISDWSSDVCSSDLLEEELGVALFARTTRSTRLTHAGTLFLEHVRRVFAALEQARDSVKAAANGFHGQLRVAMSDRSEEHTSELQSLMRISYAVFCLKKKMTNNLYIRLLLYCVIQYHHVNQCNNLISPYIDHT